MAILPPLHSMPKAENPPMASSLWPCPFCPWWSLGWFGWCRNPNDTSGFAGNDSATQRLVNFTLLNLPKNNETTTIVIAFALKQSQKINQLVWMYKCVFPCGNRIITFAARLAKSHCWSGLQQSRHNTGRKRDIQVAVSLLKSLAGQHLLAESQDCLSYPSLRAVRFSTQQLALLCHEHVGSVSQQCWQEDRYYLPVVIIVKQVPSSSSNDNPTAQMMLRSSHHRRLHRTPKQQPVRIYVSRPQDSTGCGDSTNES
jgi:hypothetical protein